MPTGHYTRKVRSFWARVEIQRDGKECWLWIGPKNRKGYGTCASGQTHRVAYRLMFGDIPLGLHVCHKCDVPACVRPNHLFTGTDADNKADMRAKGRAPAGEGQGSCKLTEVKVLSIKQMYRAGGVSHKDLAGRFQVNQSTISRIITGKRWAHLGV